MSAFLNELKRRNVVKVAAAYAAAAWLVAQVAETVFPVFEISDAVLRVLFILLGLGFPVAVVLAWIYDLTPEGIRRTDDMPEGVPRVSGRGLNFMIIGCLTVAVLFLVMDRYVWNPTTSDSGASVAVLPFSVDSNDAESSYLGDGIADSVVMRLSQLPQLSVKSRSMMRTDQTDLQALGKALGVASICKGRIARRGKMLEIFVELIRVVDGTVLWSDRLLRSMGSIVGIEREVSAEIASALSVELSDADKAALARDPTKNAEAYRLYLQGRHFWNQRSGEALRRSADLYRQAIDLDPGYALAWSGLADSYLMLYAWGIEAPQDVAPLVQAAAARAIELDSGLAEPHATIGYFKTLFERDWTGAEAAFQASIDRNPNYGTAHHWYAFLLSTTGRPKEAIKEILRARESEPLSPIINAEVGIFLVYDGQYERTIEELKRASLWNPGFPSLLFSLSRAHAMLGAGDTVSSMIDELRPYFEDNLLAYGFSVVALPRVGQEGEARAFYERALRESQAEYVAPGVLGFVAASVGEYDAAFTHFEDALDERSLIVSWLRDPLIDGIRDDPRYTELLEEIGLEP